jgi:hypothetical protein
MPPFTLMNPTARAALLADLEGLWQCFDELVGTPGPNDWSGNLATFEQLFPIKSLDFAPLPPPSFPVCAVPGVMREMPSFDQHLQENPPACAGSTLPA